MAVTEAPVSPPLIQDPAAARRELVRAEDEKAARQAAGSLRAFLPYAWPMIEPHREFKHNWHHDCLADHLEAVLGGQIKKLLINIPPATTKSLMVSVIFPGWVWIRQPWKRFLCLSYDQAAVSTRDCDRMRSLVESDFYRGRWPHVRIRGEQRQKTRFATTQGGYRIGTSFAGKIMGEHPHIKIIDDPHDPKRQLLSDADVERVVETYDNKLAARGATLDAATIIVMQRLDERDLSGHILGKSDEELVHLCLPMRWEPKRMVETPIGWKDPRQTPGELLWPEEWDLAKVDGLFKPGTWADAGQFQQRPVPTGGLMFKRNWFEVVTEVPRDMIAWVRYWDVAGTEEGAGPRTAGVKMGVTENGKFVIADVVKGRWTDQGVDQVMRTTALADGPEVLIREEQEPGSAGKAVVRARARAMAGFDYSGRPPGGDKITRARPLRSQAEVGNVVLVVADGNTWVNDFLDELEVFPVGALKDQVDAVSGAFNSLTGIGSALEFTDGDSLVDAEDEHDFRSAYAEELAKYRNRIGTNGGAPHAG